MVDKRSKRVEIARLERIPLPAVIWPFSVFPSESVQGPVAVKTFIFRFDGYRAGQCQSAGSQAVVVRAMQRSHSYDSANRLDQYLAQVLPLKRESRSPGAFVVSLCRMCVPQSQARSHRLETVFGGAEIRVIVDPETINEKIKEVRLNSRRLILFEDAGLIAVNKPAGVRANPR